MGVVITLWLLSQVPPSGASEGSGIRGNNLPPLSGWSEAELKKARYTGYLLEALLAEAGEDPESFRSRLFTLVIGTAKAIGDEEEPRRAVLRALRFFTEELGFRKCPEKKGLEAVLPTSVLKNRCGTGILVSTLFLALLDRQTFPGEISSRFSLKPFIVPGALLLRYEYKSYHFTVAPTQGAAIFSDREVSRKWPASAEARRAGVYFRPLDRAELAGLLLGELARAHGRAGNESREENAYRSAVTFYPGSPELRLGFARVLLRAGNAAEAARHVEEVLRKTPHAGEAHFLKGVALLSEGDSPAAKESLRRGIELGWTEKGKAWLYLARIAAEEQSFSELKKYLLTWREKSGRTDLTAEIDAVLDSIAVSQAVQTVKGTGPYEKRFRAVDTLKDHPTPGGTEALIECLRDHNIRFRAYAWRALCSIAGRKIPLDPALWWRWHAREKGVPPKDLWTILDLGPAPDGK